MLLEPETGGSVSFLGRPKAVHGRVLTWSAEPRPGERDISWQPMASVRQQVPRLVLTDEAMVFYLDSNMLQVDLALRAIASHRDYVVDVGVETMMSRMALDSTRDVSTQHMNDKMLK